jgi:amino acid permease
MRLLVVTIACGVIGVGLMVPFEAAITRVLGVAALLAFIVCGLFLIATPESLGSHDDQVNRSSTLE